MLKLIVTLPALLFLSLCRGDETVVRYGAADKTWVLQELNGAAFTANATLIFPEPGRIAGNGPCNSFSGAMTVPYPWFEAVDIAATKRACPDLTDEGRFFTALAEATFSEVLDDTLILSDQDGLEMVFKAGD